MRENENGGLDAWFGLAACLLFALIYYVAVLPVWQGVYSAVIVNPPGAFTAAWYDYLRWILDWAPVGFVIIALFWAFISPTRRQGVTWREI